MRTFLSISCQHELHKAYLFYVYFSETYLSTQLDKDTFTITACMHPSTYLNKILFGSKQGKLQLWNIRTK